MVKDEVMIRAVKLPEKDKARAWNYFMGYIMGHAMVCAKEDCVACNGVNTAMNEGLEENT